MRANDIAAAILGHLVELVEPVARLIDHLVIALHPSCRRDPAAVRTSIAVPPGLYRDRFGALWERTTTGWQLWLRSGKTLEVMLSDADINCGIKSFAPFTPLVIHSPSRW